MSHVHEQPLTCILTSIASALQSNILRQHAGLMPAEQHLLILSSSHISNMVSTD